jgi:hydroxymethylpyrimidine pyrophosphatase-like HAD family hydrolase
VTPRLVATDLDGTLLHTDGELSARTREVLAALDEHGVPVVFVTARPLRWMTELWDAVGGHGVAIVSNGAIVYDVAAHEIHELEGIEAEAGLALVAAIRAAVPTAVFAFELVSGFAHEPAYDEPHHIPDGSPSGPAEELLADTAVKVLVKAPGTEPAALREAVCAGLGVDAADVVAFGDMPNDLPMLAWAGTSYAVANAHPTVLEAVDHVAPSNDEDGVAQVLAGIFDL